MPLGIRVRAVWGVSALLRLQALLTFALGHGDARGMFAHACTHMCIHTRVCSSKETRGLPSGFTLQVSMVGRLSSAPWLGFGEELGAAGITFAFKLSLPLLEAVCLRGPPRCQRGPPTRLCAGRWVHRTSPSTAAPPDAGTGLPLPMPQVGALPTPPLTQRWVWWPGTPFQWVFGPRENAAVGGERG